jgi:vacuolar iron transporter family protein
MSELAGIYERGGLARALASEVAPALSRAGSAPCDEAGLDQRRPARPFQGAWTSALSFSRGGAAIAGRRERPQNLDGPASSW